MIIKDFIRLKSINVLLLIILFSCSSKLNLRDSNYELNDYIDDYIKNYCFYSNSKELKSILIYKDIDRNILNIMDIPIEVVVNQDKDYKKGMYKNILCVYDIDIYTNDIFKKVDNSKYDKYKKERTQVELKKGLVINLENNYLNWTPTLEIQYDLINKGKVIKTN